MPHIQQEQTVGFLAQRLIHFACAEVSTYSKSEANTLVAQRFLRRSWCRRSALFIDFRKIIVLDGPVISSGQRKVHISDHLVLLHIGADIDVVKKDREIG